MRKRGKTCSTPNWLPVLVVLVGLWFILEDLNILRTGISLWPVVVTLIGIKMWSKCS
jgi:hypothetical protein